MYFPYLRGKQFELLALRELGRLPLSAEKISPIVEPLKKETKGLETLVKALHINNVPLQLIVNPEHGDLKTISEPIFNVINSLHSQGYRNVVPAYIINKEKDFRLLKSSIVQYGYDSSGYSLIHLNQISETAEMGKLLKTLLLIALTYKNWKQNFQNQ